MWLGESWLARGLRAQLRARRTIVWAAVLFLAAALCASQPLFGVLGYEFALVMALVGSFAGADMGASLVRRLRGCGATPVELAEEPSRICSAIVFRAIALSVALLLPPLLVMAINGLRIRNCDWLFGIKCYLLITCVSTALAATLGVICGLAAGERRKLSNVLPHAVLVASILAAVWRFYSAPPVFSYNPFAGYFPGNLYDESIELLTPFYWARLLHVVVAIGAIALASSMLDSPTLRMRLGARPVGWRWRPLSVALGSALAASTLWSQSAELGFALDADDISAQLGGRYETEHFIIHFQPGGDIERDIELIAEDHEFRRAQLVQRLGVDPEGKITSYYFNSPDQKFRLMGARRVYMAKPWRSEIYLNHSPYPHRVLRHELAHVMAGEFGDAIFHISYRRFPFFVNVGMVEGIAVAADWPDRFTNTLTPHESVKVMRQLDMAPPVSRLFSTGFLAFSAARSYTVAGSYLRYLLDEHGIDKLQALYRSGGDFLGVYGMSQGALTERWLEFIDGVELPPGAAEKVRERFRRRGIFSRPCPHAIARAKAKVGRLRASGRLDEAIELARDICADAGREPQYLLDLGALLARAERTDEAVETFSELAEDEEHLSSTVRAAAYLELAELRVKADDLTGAASLLQTASELHVDDSLGRQITTRLIVLRHTGPAAQALRDYFWGSSPGDSFDPLVAVVHAGEAARLEPSSGLAHYLLGRQLSARGAPQTTVIELSRALDAGLPTAQLERETARLLAAAAYTAGDLATVERAAAILTRRDQSTMDRLHGADWLERVHWKRTGEIQAAHETTGGP